MEPVLEHLLPEREESFFVHAFDLPYFNTPWHYHPEFELVLIVRSEGKRFIGNMVSDFREGDLVLLGSDLPHLFKNTAAYYDPGSGLRAQSIVIQFLKEALGKDFWDLPQAGKFRTLFERSRRGMDITGKAREQLLPKMKRIVHLKGIRRLICLLEILDQLAETNEYKLISDADIVGHNRLDAGRLDVVFQYILENYRRQIRLEEVAGLICMTRTSFCRFFQERTQRTFSDYLAEMRLTQASRRLIEGTASVQEISYECGYNNLSNFNRQFKRKFSVSPLTYRKMNFR